MRVRDWRPRAALSRVRQTQDERVASKRETLARYGALGVHNVRCGYKKKIPEARKS